MKTKRDHRNRLLREGESQCKDHNMTHILRKRKAESNLQLETGSKGQTSGR